MTKADDLRTVATLLDDSRLETEPVGDEYLNPGAMRLTVLCDNINDLLGVRRRLAELGGDSNWQKYTTNYSYGFQGNIRGVAILIWADRENVCEAVTEEVTEMVPDPSVEVPLVEVTTKKITWVCPESLLAEVGE